MAAQPGWNDLPAVLAGEVYLIDHVYFSRPGPRIVEGIEILAQLTHPDRFTGMAPAGTVAKLDAAAYRSGDDIGRCFSPFQ